MKLALIVFLSSFSFTVFASDHTYDVSGTDGNGNTVQGTVDSNNGDRNVSGEVTDENGDTHSFEGQWDGYGHVSGQTDEGEQVELDAN